MGIMNVKKAIIIFLLIGVLTVAAGCARWPDGPGPGPGEPEYQLEITVEVKGEINTDEGIYYIAFDADSNSIDGPDDDLNFWENDYYYIMLDGTGFYFAQVKDSSESYFSGGSITGTNQFQITIAISDLGDPTRIDINVLTTDSDNNTYDHLDGYFTINTTVLGSTGEGVISGGGTGGTDFDITKVTAVITTLY